MSLSVLTQTYSENLRVIYRTENFHDQIKSLQAVAYMFGAEYTPTLRHIMVYIINSDQQMAPRVIRALAVTLLFGYLLLLHNYKSFCMIWCNFFYINYSPSVFVDLCLFHWREFSHLIKIFCSVTVTIKFFYWTTRVCMELKMQLILVLDNVPGCWLS